jgi:hypothetical protein
MTSSGCPNLVAFFAGRPCAVLPSRALFAGIDASGSGLDLESP